MVGSMNASARVATSHRPRRGPPTTLNTRDQPPAESQHQKVSDSSTRCNLTDEAVRRLGGGLSTKGWLQAREWTLLPW
jgi:hypothetical protein